jgi:hypothetical protein
LRAPEVKKEIFDTVAGAGAGIVGINGSLRLG